MHKAQTSSLEAGGALNNFTPSDASTSALPPNCSSVITRAPGTTWTGLHPVFLFNSATQTPSDKSIIYRNFPNITFFLSAFSTASVAYWKQTMLQRKISLSSSDIILHPLVFQARVLYQQKSPCLSRSSAWSTSGSSGLLPWVVANNFLQLLPLSHLSPFLSTQMCSSGYWTYPQWKTALRSERRMQYCGKKGIEKEKHYDSRL